MYWQVITLVEFADGLHRRLGDERALAAAAALLRHRVIQLSQRDFVCCFVLLGDLTVLVAVDV